MSAIYTDKFIHGTVGRKLPRCMTLFPKKPNERREASAEKFAVTGRIDCALRCGFGLYAE